MHPKKEESAPAAHPVSIEKPSNFHDLIKGKKASNTLRLSPEADRLLKQASELWGVSRADVASWCICVAFAPALHPHHNQSAPASAGERTQDEVQSHPARTHIFTKSHPLAAPASHPPTSSNAPADTLFSKLDTITERLDAIVQNMEKGGTFRPDKPRASAPEKEEGAAAAATKKTTTAMVSETAKSPADTEPKTARDQIMEGIEKMKAASKGEPEKHPDFSGWTDSECLSYDLVVGNEKKTIREWLEPLRGIGNHHNNARRVVPAGMRRGENGPAYFIRRAFKRAAMAD